MPNAKTTASFLLVLSLATYSQSPTYGSELQPDKPIIPKNAAIKLFNGHDLDGLYTFLEDTEYADPRNVFTVREGLLVVSGDGYGGISTKQAFANYRLVCEFKWGCKTWGARKERARDSGLLVHGNGPDNAFAGRWMTSIEAQIIEGGVGDILVVNECGGEDQPSRVSVTSEVATDRDGEAVWAKGGVRRTFCEGRINWFGRDVDWTDTLGFRGTGEIGYPRNEWTRMDVICKGDSIQILVNSVLVNEAFDVTPSSGRITLQSEGAEIVVRRWELWPLVEHSPNTALPSPH
jgi:hypothetical protein